MVINYDLPEDVVIEILSRLPVKSLMRFRCVCKSWCALMKDLTFITNHLNQQEADNKKNGHLLVHNYDEDTRKFVFSFYSDKTLALPVYQYLDLSLNADANVLGPCNGIFCLFNGQNGVALWNPAMRQFRTLPGFPRPDLPPGMVLSYSVFGFGLDTKTNDYKVIWIRIFVDENDEFDEIQIPGPRHCKHKQVGVYTLSKNSWRDLNGNALLPAQDVFTSKFYSFANGFYYWLAWGDNQNSLILSFDMTNEVFLAIPAPRLPEPELETSWRRFAFYNDYVAWILYDHNEEERCYSIWVLEEELWTKKVTIGPLLGVEIPLGFWKDGGLLLQCRTTAELVLSNSINGEIRGLGTEPVQVFIYCESLVSVKEGNGSSDHAVPNFFAVGSIIRRDYDQVNSSLFIDNTSSSSSCDFPQPPRPVFLSELQSN